MGCFWPTTELGEIIDLFDSRRIPLSSRDRQQRQGQFPYYGAQGVIDYIDDFIFEGRYILVAEDGENLNSRKLPLALVAGGRFWVNNHAHILKGKPGVVDDIFLLHCLNCADIKPYVTGAAQPKLSQANLRKIPIALPPFSIQRRIAGILSAYDDLIENSQRRIKILEEMARRLYREWFVYFRFPGYEGCRFVESPLGEIPEGWRICALSELVQFKSGFAFKSGTFAAGGKHRLITIKNVQDGIFNPDTDTYIGDLPEKMPPYCLLANNDVLLSLTGNVGRVCLVYAGPFLLNQRVAKLAPVEAFDWALVYSMFRQAEIRVKLELLSNGVAQQNLSPVIASKMEIIKPPRELRRSFSRLAEPIMLNIVQLYTSIQNLRRTRDLLLPRLLSGQIDVEALPEPTAEAHASSSN